ncbi:hypothetical protein BSKO_02174 [Bryopsis sp. KO-2023]|nr:hypothetical protein BSKO_02174 [Bryopsis sp. KO-2023]
MDVCWQTCVWHLLGFYGGLPPLKKRIKSGWRGCYQLSLFLVRLCHSKQKDSLRKKKGERYNQKGKKNRYLFFLLFFFFDWLFSFPNYFFFFLKT